MVNSLFRKGFSKDGLLYCEEDSKCSICKKSYSWHFIKPVYDKKEKIWKWDICINCIEKHNKRYLRKTSDVEEFLNKTKRRKKN